MKTMQPGAPLCGPRRCIVFFAYACGALLLAAVFGLGLFASAEESVAAPPAPAAQAEAAAADAEAPAPRGGDGSDLHDHAVVYLDRYFEPEPHLTLSEDGQRRSRALAHYALGRALEAQGRPAEAVEAYRVVIENAPGEHFLARKTAFLLARNGRNDEALRMLEENLEKNPGEPYAYITLGEFLHTYHNGDEARQRRAVELFEEAVERFPEEAGVYEPLVQVYLSGGRVQDAVALMRGVLEKEIDRPEFWLQTGRTAARLAGAAREGDESVSSLVEQMHRRALRHSKGEPRVLEAVADYLHETGQFEEAADLYSMVIEKEADRLDLREKLARVREAMGDEEGVIAALQGILEIDTENVRALKQIAQIHMRAERFAEAIPYLRRSLAITKGSPAEYGALAQLMMEAREYEQAVEFLETASQIFPEVVDFAYFRAVCLSQLERYPESVEEFDRAVELSGGEDSTNLNERFFFSYAAANERMGEIERATELFQKSIDLISKNDPDHSNQRFVALVYNYLGYMWLENDLHIDEAGELIKTAIDLDPENGAITDSLGWYQFKVGEYQEALETLLRAAELIEEPDAVIYDHIGQAYFMVGDKAKAVEYLEKAVSMKPEEEEFSERLEEYRQALAAEPEDADAAPSEEAPPAEPENASDDPVA